MKNSNPKKGRVNSMENHLPEDIEEFVNNADLLNDELTRLDVEITAIEPKLQRLERQRQIATVAAGVLPIIAGVVVGAFRKDFFTECCGYYDGPTTGEIVAITLFFALFTPLYVYFLFGLGFSSLRRHYDQLVTKRQVLLKLFPKGDSDHLLQKKENETYFDKLVQINVSNLAQYYALVKIHTDNSFKVSLVTGLVGFTLIMLGILFGFFTNTRETAIAYIAAGSGVITEFIAGTFFFLYNRTVRQLKDYHDSLISVQNILLSFKIIGDLTDESDKAKIVSRMLVSLVESPKVRSDAKNA